MLKLTIYHLRVLQQFPCMLAGSAAGTDSGVSESGSRSAVLQGAGPRIYVGGIPNAVSETMVRKYFSNWGKVRPLTGSKQFSQYRSFQFIPVLCSLPRQCLVSQMRCILGISSCLTQHPHAVDVTTAALFAIMPCLDVISDCIIICLTSPDIACCSG